MNIISKMLDLCLLIETEAYITHTTRCDLEVMKEVADRVRNPVTVIGGNIRRLQKKMDATSKEYDLLQRLFMENQRLEGMMQDIRVYMEVFAGEPRVQKLDLDELIGLVLGKLRAEDPATRNQVNVKRETGTASPLYCRRRRMVFSSCSTICFRTVLRLLAPDTGFIEISSRLEDGATRNVRVEIFNTGAPLEAEEMERLFAPFYSTKVTGTGFGLAIAQVLARKHYGKIDLQPVPEGGVRVTVTLPRAERNGGE